MIGLILGLIVIASMIYGSYRTWEWAKRRDLEPLTIIGVIGSIMLSLIIVPLLIKSVDGLYPGYSEGQRTGYLTKISYKGVLWKTWEGELQIGAGEQAALQTPFAFSVTDPEVMNAIKANLGKRVTVEYREWLAMPYRVGSSGYEITKVTVQEDSK